MANPREAGRILALWSAPRSRSTAFFRMMSERGDFTPVHEPFSYLAEFGKSTVGDEEAHTEQELLAALRRESERRPVFFKDTTDERYAGVLADEEFLARDAGHAFLIRHPRETIASYYAINPEVRRDQIGFSSQYELFVRVCEATGRTPLVIDAADLVADPRSVVETYCERMGIAFLAESMSWRAESRSEWEPSEKWHRDVSASSGFEAKRRSDYVDVDSHPVLGAYLEYHLPYYEKLHEHRVRI